MLVSPHLQWPASGYSSLNLFFSHSDSPALHEELDGKPFVVEFDFLGKDSIRYYNRVPVEKQVFKNLKHFVRDKAPSDDLFDRLTVSLLRTV